MHFEFDPLTTKDTEWNPADVKVTLNICTEACIVPSDEHSARLSLAHVIVLDEFLNQSLQQELLETITEKNWTESASSPPGSNWSRETCDQAGLPASWGLQDTVLKQLLSNPSAAMIELQSRLCKLYPEFSIFHMPSEFIQTNERSEGVVYDCDKFVANAAVYGDSFQWHVDADPWTFPESSNWVQQFGHYFNGEPKKPLFVSLIVYLNSNWERDWDGETLFLDSHTETGIFIRPKMGRVVLMEQDVLHRLSCPSRNAKRPRYSLVWKLIFVPKNKHQIVKLSRPEFGEPTHFGSAAKVKAVQDAIFSETKY
eukprot:g1664.t1